MTDQVAKVKDPETPDGGAQRPSRRPYVSPRLQVYGAVQDLTAGGTGNAQEPSMGLKPRP